MNTLPNELVARILGYIADRGTLENIASLGGRYYWLAQKCMPNYFIVRASEEHGELLGFWSRSDRDRHLKLLEALSETYDRNIPYDLIGSEHEPTYVSKDEVNAASEAYEKWNLTRDFYHDYGDDEARYHLIDVLIGFT